MSKIDTLSFSQTIKHLDGYRGVAQVRGTPPVYIDEPEVLGGEDTAPCPMDYLLSAVGGCLMSSLALGLQKKRVEGDIDVRMLGTVERDGEGMLRVGDIDVTLLVTAAEEDWKKVQSAYEVFKKFCIVSESVARGIPTRTRLELQTPCG